MDNKHKKTYPLPYVIPDLKDWPLAQLNQDRESFMKDAVEHIAQELMSQKSSETLSERLVKVLYKERQRITKEPWKVDPPDELDFWNDIRRKILKKSLDSNDAQTEEHNQQLLKRIVERYVVEIMSNFQISKYKIARKVLPKMFNTLLNTSSLFKPKSTLEQKLGIVGSISHVRKLLDKDNCTIVLVPTHFSNLDSIMIGWAADQIGLTALSYGAGINLYNAKALGYIFPRLGAYGVDRRKKNAVYLDTLKAFSQLTIERGVHSLFFPGGTRSRSGMLEKKLKMGLLGTAVNAQGAIYQRGEDRKVYIVPVVLNYHFVLEAKNLIDSYLKRMGKENYLIEKKAFGGSWNLMKFLWKFFGQDSEIMVNFCKPMDVLGNFVDEEGNSVDKFGKVIDTKSYFISDGRVKFDRQRNAEYTKRLAQRIVERYTEENIVLSSHLLAYTAFNIFRVQYKSLDLYGILRLPKDDCIILKSIFYDNVKRLRKRLLELEAEGAIQLSQVVKEGSLEELVEDGIRNVGTFHVKKALSRDKEGDIFSEDLNLLYYYHNRMKGYDLKDYLVVNVLK